MKTAGALVYQSAAASNSVRMRVDEGQQIGASILAIACWLDDCCPLDHAVPESVDSFGSGDGAALERAKRDVTELTEMEAERPDVDLLIGADAAHNLGDLAFGLNC